jgi:lysylphosphatidylglycerol synthetase-like protein (DUF2156 family)
MDAAPGYRHWFDGDDARVAYVDTGRAWIAAGAPLAAPSRAPEAARAFLTAARAAGRRAAFFGTEAPFVERTPGLRALAIGEQPSWSPAAWRETLAGAPSLRAQLGRARRKGVTVRRVEAAELGPRSPTRVRVERLGARWLAGRRLPPMGFVVQPDALSRLDERRCFVAERGAGVVGFLSAAPVYGRRGWLFEHLWRDGDAPNGTNELLFDAAMRDAGAAGCDYATLGLAPLAGRVPWWLRLARAGGRGWFDFEGLAAWKRKLRPGRWSPIFLSYEADRSAPGALADALTAFAHGRLWSFGLRALLR